MHAFEKFLVIDTNRKPPHSHTVSEHDDKAAAERNCWNYNMAHYNDGRGSAKGAAYVLAKQVQEG